MDLNNLAPAQPPAHAEPARTPLRVVRLPRAATPDTEPKIFEGGEALPESQGEDFDLPISPEERQALLDAGYDGADIDLIAKSGPEVEDEVINPFTYGQDLRLRTGSDALVKAMEDLRELAERNSAQAEYEAKQAAIEATYYSRPCPLPTCDAIARVPKGSDHGDVLGLGMSMGAAQELEHLLLTHLSTHPFGDWIAALKQLQDQLDALQTQQYVSPPQAGIVQGEAGVGVIPGPAQRSPEKQAAVDALDRRLGRPATPQSPQDVAAHDAALRARRAAQRAAPPPDPYTLTPRWSSEQGDGTVGIKR